MLVLVTLGDTEERRRYLNARSTIDRLLEWRSVPVINENDTVATSEIRYGDNDRLAVRVATMVSLKIRSFPVLGPDRKILGVISRGNVMRALKQDAPGA